MGIDAGLAALSNNLLAATMLAYIVAMFGYTIEYAFGRRKVLVMKAPAKVLVGAGVSETTEPEVVTRQEPNGKAVAFGWLGVVATVVGVLLQIGCLTARGFAADRVPWGNMYEFVLAVCTVAVVAWLVMVARRPVRHLGVFVMPVVVLLLGIASNYLYVDTAPLVPALNSYWIKLHVSAAAIGSGLFLVGFVLGVLYLIRNAYDKRVAASAKLRFPTTLGPRLPKADALERLTFRVHAIAFPVWTVMIILGAIWAEEAWSRYWGWDPKEQWSFISWVVYAAYLHARATVSWRGVKATWIVILGWATMMVNLFVINLVTSGLHSYAGM